MLDDTFHQYCCHRETVAWTRLCGHANEDQSSTEITHGINCNERDCCTRTSCPLWQTGTYTTKHFQTEEGGGGRRKKREGKKKCVCVCVCVFSRPIIRSCNVSVPVPAADPSRCETVFSSAMFETVKMLETQTPN